jgi:hypothetical protein
MAFQSMKKFLFALVALMILLSSCTAPPAAAMSTSIPPTTLPPTATFTPLPPSATPTETVTPTSTPDAHLTVKCLDILPELPANVQLQGTLVLGTFYGKTNQSYLFNLETGEKIPLLGRDDEIRNSFSVSPDSHWLAYTSARTKEVATDRLIIMGANGRPVKDRLISTREWDSMVGWLNSQQLLFQKYDAEKIYSHPLSTIVYNPFSTEQQEILPSFADIRQDIPQWPEWDEYSQTETVPDPTLSFIVYQGANGKSVLWNRKDKKEIGFFQNSLNYYMNKPVWSPDGSMFLENNIVSGDGVKEDFSFTELFSMNRRGEIRQLTHLSSRFSNSYIDDYLWSPNMRYISFWLNSEPTSIQNPTGTGHSLAVLDMESGKVTDYCIESTDIVKIPNGGTLMGPFENPAIWSPDSQKFLVFVSNGKDKGMTVLVNIVEGYAAKITEDMLPIGWLTNAP